MLIDVLGIRKEFEFIEREDVEGRYLGIVRRNKRELLKFTVEFIMRWEVMVLKVDRIANSFVVEINQKEAEKWGELNTVLIQNLFLNLSLNIK